ncbi:uncharacterized protein K441DRAFT_233315 [Cenococcum geophilum 1.58]|uniref:uncharacterized protein n=1 Tax=Cenococcum geophilum 1.58 TaxID=794803 RepID=UPI00358F4CAE|nr:hypothetical protein K441DRAFT_233315 [Cenococcum geophilum 1.58]
MAWLLMSVAFTITIGPSLAASFNSSTALLYLVSCCYTLSNYLLLNSRSLSVDNS